MGYGRKEKHLANWTAERIKDLRKSYDESQSRFARRIGVSTAALQFWEQGRGDGVTKPIENLLDRLKEDADADEIRTHPDDVHAHAS